MDYIFQNKVPCHQLRTVLDQHIIFDLLCVQVLLKFKSCVAPQLNVINKMVSGCMMLNPTRAQTIPKILNEF